MRRRAENELASLPRQAQEDIDEKIQSLRDDPRPHGSTLLEAKERLYRIRVGRYRVIYQISDEEKLVTIAKIGDRKEIYKRL